MNDPRVHATFKRFIHSNLTIFIISQDYFEIQKRTITANGNIYHIFERKNFRVVQNLYQDKASMDMVLNEYKYLTKTCLDQNYRPFIVDMTKDKYGGR